MAEAADYKGVVIFTCKGPDGCIEKVGIGKWSSENTRMFEVCKASLILLQLPRVLGPICHSFILLPLVLLNRRLWDVSSHCLLFVLVLLPVQIQMHLLQVRKVWPDLVG
jgi:hypothetical protein